MEQELLDVQIVPFDLPPHKRRERIKSSDSGRGSSMCSPVLAAAAAPDGDGGPSDSGSSSDEEPPPPPRGPERVSDNPPVERPEPRPKPYHTEWEESIIQRKRSCPEEFIMDTYVPETYILKKVRYLWTSMVMEKRIWKVYKWSDLFDFRRQKDTDFGFYHHLRGWASYIGCQLGITSQEQMFARLEIEVTHVSVAARWTTQIVGNKPEHFTHSPGDVIHQCESEEPVEPIEIQRQRLQEEWEEIVRKYPNVMHVPTKKILHNFSEEMMS